MHPAAGAFSPPITRAAARERLDRYAAMACGGAVAIWGGLSLVQFLTKGRAIMPIPLATLTLLCLGVATFLDALTRLEPWASLRRFLGIFATFLGSLAILPTFVDVSVASSLAIALAGIALVGRREAEDPVIRGIAPIVTFLIGLTGVVSSVYHIELGGTQEPRFAPSLQAAIAMCIVSLGILLARPQIGLVRIANADSVSGLIMRRLLLPTVIAPPLIGAFVARIQEVEIVSPGMALALFSALNIAFFAALILWTGFVALTIDKKRTASELLLADSEERFRATFEQAAVGICHVSPDGRFLRVNSKFAAILGYEPAELIGKTFGDVTYADDLDRDNRNVELLLAGRIDTYTMEKRYVRRDRSITWVCLTVSLIRAADGSPKYFISVAQDFDEKKRAEFELLALKAELEQRVVQRGKELAQSTLRYKGIIDSMSDTVVACDLEQRIFAMNSALKLSLKQLNGIEVQIGDKFPDAAGTDVQKRASYEALFERGLREDFSINFSSQDIQGETRTFDITANRLKDEDGNVLGVIFASRDVTDKIRIAHALAAAKSEAERASQAKSVFLANVSHELRTPLGVIMGYSDLLSNPHLTDSERVETARIIRRNTDNLLAVVNDLLDLSKAEAKQISATPSRISLVELITEVVAFMRLQAQGKDLSLSWVLDGEVPDTIVSDPNRLRQILLNLLSNAVKFTDRGGVELTVLMRDDAGTPQLVFRIKDTGIGIAKEDQALLFKPFSQAGTPKDIRRGGTGLGLSLAKSLARALGGDARLIESTPGLGATFEFTIAPNLPDASDRKEHEHTTDRIDGDQEPAISASCRGISILLVEDMPDNQLLFRKLLEDAGARVQVVGSGEQALSTIASGVSPDLVLMDVQMPGLDGHQTTQELRRRGFTRPIVALTAHAMREERERCAASGFTGFLSKPIHRGPLLAAVHEYAR